LETTVIVVVSCHFAEKDKLCPTTLNRLSHALKCAAECEISEGRIDVAFVVTGNVPYEKGSKTLAELMREYLFKNYYIHLIYTRVHIGEGVGIFSESRNVTHDVRKLIHDASKIIVVSSNWYFWAGAPLWKKFGQENGLEVQILPIYGTGGWKTKLIYAVYGLIVRASLIFGFSSLVEKQLTKMQLSRKEGFTFDGCR